MKYLIIFLLLGIVLTKALTSPAKDSNKDLEGIMNQNVDSNSPGGALVVEEEEEEPSSQTQEDASSNWFWRRPKRYRYCHYVRVKRCYYRYRRG